MQPEMAKKIIQNTKKDYPDGIGAYGTDALRFTFASLASNGRDINFDLKRVEGYRNFCNKLWNAARFVKMQGEAQINDLGDYSLKNEELWIRNKLGELIQDTKNNYKNYRFDYATKHLYSYIWQDYCSWYIEISKSKLNAKDVSEDEKKLIIFNLRDILKNILLLLHPIMPFITEEIYKDLFDENRFLQDNSYPNSKDFLNNENTDNVTWMIEIVSAVRKTRSEIGVQPNKMIDIYVTGENDKDKDFFSELSSLIKSLAKIKNIEFGENTDSNFYTCVSNNIKMLIPSSDLVDIKSEIERLTKEKVKYENSSKGIESRLSNEDFIKNAPGHIVVADEQKLKELKTKILKIEEQIKIFF